MRHANPSRLRREFLFNLEHNEPTWRRWRHSLLRIPVASWASIQFARRIAHARKNFANALVAILREL